jgi:hypothetical protein
MRLGSFEGRRTMAVIAFIPQIALFGDPWSVNDDKLVCDLCPTDHDLRLWVWIVEHEARRVFGTQEFSEAFAAARDRIEQQLAEA